MITSANFLARLSDDDLDRSIAARQQSLNSLLERVNLAHTQLTAATNEWQSRKNR